MERVIIPLATSATMELETSLMMSTMLGGIGDTFSRSSGESSNPDLLTKPIIRTTMPDRNRVRPGHRRPRTEMRKMNRCHQNYTDDHYQDGYRTAKSHTLDDVPPHVHIIQKLLSGLVVLLCGFGHQVKSFLFIELFSQLFEGSIYEMACQSSCAQL